MMKKTMTRKTKTKRRATKRISASASAHNVLPDNVEREDERHLSFMRIFTYNGQPIQCALFYCNVRGQKASADTVVSTLYSAWLYWQTRLEPET